MAGFVAASLFFGGPLFPPSSTKLSPHPPVTLHEVTPPAWLWQDSGVCYSGGKRMNLKNAVAVITGGSSGIGRAIAKSLVTSGARVAITGRDPARLAETARELGVHSIPADVSIEAEVEQTYRNVLQQFGDLDILVNNAGSGVFR